jgi:26S proteasome regulatory subunit T4
MFTCPKWQTSDLTFGSGLFAIKDYRDAVNQDDFNKAVRKVAESKKLEGKLEYQKL